MSATVSDPDFYQNLLQFMNQSSENPFLNTVPTFSPHEAEKHSLDESMIEDTDPKRRGVFE